MPSLVRSCDEQPLSEQRGGGASRDNSRRMRSSSTRSSVTTISRSIALYGDLQQRGPIRIKLPFGEPCWLATRYEDAKFTYGDRRFGKALGVGRDTPRSFEAKIDDPTLMANQDPPDHTRLRRLTSGAFAPAQIRSMRQWIVGLVDGLLDGLAAEEQPDFVPLVAWPLPMRVIGGILGVSEAEVPKFRRYRRRHALDRQSDGDETGGPREHEGGDPRPHRRTTRSQHW